MSLTVVTVVISNDQPNFLENCLSAVEKQSFRSERVIVVDTSTVASMDSVLDAFISRSSNHAVIRVEEKANFAELAALGIKQVLADIENLDSVAVWLLHDDTVPELHALAELVRTFELSPMVGIASPKQLALDNPRLIVQQGLTLTKTLKPFSIVNDELDQKQHDGMSDVLAVSSNAMLIRANLWVELGGFSLSAPLLAQDIELGIRARHLGYRVVVVPSSRVRHGELSLNGKRARKWLGGSAKYALAKATNHLRISQSPLALAFLYWLTLPVTSLIQFFWLMLLKRPDRILLTLRANLWAFFTFRTRLRDRHGYKIKTLRSLFASTAELKARRRLGLERVEQQENLSSFESQRERSQLSFAAGGGLWIMLGLVALSFNFFPLGEAARGGYALPLSDSWLQLFANTAASYQHIGLGLAAPSDPFNWLLLLIGSITFFAPNLAFSWLLILAKPLAFFGVWRLVSTFTARNSLRIVLALVYVLWPTFTAAQSEGNFSQVLFAICFPWLLFSLIRTANLGIKSSVRSSSQNWSWFALSSLLFAFTWASAPSSSLVLIVVAVVFTFLLGKRFVLGLFALVPLAVIAGPYVLYAIVQNANPLSVLIDPTLAIPNQQITFSQSLFGTDPLFMWFALGLLVFLSLSIISRSREIGMVWIFALLGLANLWLVSSLTFPGGGLGSINFGLEGLVYLNTAPAVTVIVLLLLLASAVWLDSITRSGLRKIAVGLLLVAGIAPLSAASVLQPRTVSYGEARNLPAIFTAEAQAGSQLRLLVITGNSEQSFRAEIVQSGGIRLDEISTAYRMSPANLSKDYADKEELSLLVANLVSANGQDIQKSLELSGVGFILVPQSSSNSDIQVALNSAPELDQVGTTEFGQLWRVKAPVDKKTNPDLAYWSITKGIQLAVLFGFILLALPTARARKQRISNELGEGEQE